VTAVIITGEGAGIEHVVAVARRGAKVRVTAKAMERVRRARVALDQVAGSGQQIYGLNTGLGANLRTPVTGDAAAFQRQLVVGRSGAVGEPLPTDVARATMFARAATLAVGGSGISPQVLEALIAALNAGVHPVMPSLGSIGAGDLVLMATLARVLIGEGEAEFEGRRVPAAEALAGAGLKPVALAPKDGLSLINASAVSVGHGALAAYDALQAYAQAQQAAALTMEGLGANRSILDARLHAARPAFGQEQAAADLRCLLKSHRPVLPTTLQDPLSIRCVPSVHGALYDSAHRARLAVETELASAGDNPLVLAEDGVVMSTGNFHTAALSLAFETLGLAIAQAATGAAARFIQLTGAGRNGLPRYLSPEGGASAGFVPLQKTVAAIFAAIRHKANPVMLDFLPVSEGVEDHAAQTPLVVAKCAEMIELWRRLIAFEMMAAAQAVDLQKTKLASGTAKVYAAVREAVAPLDEDRPLGTDAEALYAALSSGKWQA
jgi:histidine ammonia-lyase